MNILLIVYYIVSCDMMYRVDVDNIFIIYLQNITGFGKTLCYACLPLVFDKLTWTKEVNPSIVLVLTPLNATMRDQVCPFIIYIVVLHR